jgi:hypothetical protein
MDAIPGVYKAFLDRDQAVGENEAKRGAVIILREEGINSNTDNQVTLALTLTARISIYVNVQVEGPTLAEQADPIWQAINTIMHGSARALPGVQGVKFILGQPEVDGDAGRTDLIYNLMIRVNQLDLTQPSS